MRLTGHPFMRQPPNDSRLTGSNFSITDELATNHPECRQAICSVLAE